MVQFRSSRHAIAAALLASAGTATLALPAAAEIPKFLALAAASEKADFDLYFPIRDRATLEALVAAQNHKGAPEYQNWLTPQQFAQRFGPTPATVAGVTAELATRGLTVTVHQGLMLHVTGNAAAVQAAFGVHLSHARFAGGFEALVADRAPVMPPVLAASGAGTPQFTTAPPMHKHSYLKRYLGAVPQNSSSTTGPYLTADLRQAYDFPSALALTASGVTIGILDAGDFLASDMTTYFGGTYPVQDGLPASLTPNVLPSIPINGGTPFSVANSGETELDIQQAGGTALAANIQLYNLSDLGTGTIMAGLNALNTANVADVVSMSFGLEEAALLPQNNGGTSLVSIATMLDAVFLQGTSQGITFVASSGDSGSNPLVETPNGFVQTLSVSYPASDPFVVAVGGTNLVTQSFAPPNFNSSYIGEIAVEDPTQTPTDASWGSGGGISVLWSKPHYQTLITTPSATSRTVPDLALHMGGLGAFGCPAPVVACPGPNSSDIEILGGGTFLSIGTSESAPDIAGLLALKVAQNGANGLVGTARRLGWENVAIYTLAASANVALNFHHTGIQGFNGTYSTSKTTAYDLVLGNGTVDARRFLGATALPAAGIPGSTTNP